ncbi:hypothetical protein [Lysobacter tyrosinilyticus]
MSKQDKFIGGITTAHALLGSLWAVWIASQIGYPIAFVGTNLALALAGAVAGIGWLRNVRWAGYLVLLFYAIQLVHVTTPDYQFLFTLGFNLSISVGWFAPSAELGFNLFAGGMLLWASFRPRFIESTPAVALSDGA